MFVRPARSKLICMENKFLSSVLQSAQWRSSRVLVLSLLAPVLVVILFYFTFFWARDRIKSVAVVSQMSAADVESVELSIPECLLNRCLGKTSMLAAA